MLSFELTRADAVLIEAIAEHCVAIHSDLFGEAGGPGYRELVMDLTACHANGCPLDLAELLNDLAEDGGDALHDIAGIKRHLDRDSGLLGGAFLPRFAAPQAEGAE